MGTSGTYDTGKISIDEMRANVENYPEPERSRFLCKNDLRYLCTEVLGYKDWDKVHDKMVKFLWESKKQRYLIMVPRGHLKSSIFTIGWSIQRILNDFDIRILISNVKWGNAKNFLNQVKQLLQLPTLTKLFGEFKAEKGEAGLWNKENITIAQRRVPKPEPTIATCGTESEQTSQHYDIIIHDDIVARDNVSTPEQREKIRNYYRDSMSLLEPGTRGICAVIGTPWHDDDLYQDLKPDPLFDVFEQVAYTDRYDSVADYVVHDLIFPKKFTFETLMQKKKEIGVYLFSAQYMLNPYPDEDQEFKQSWFHYYKELDMADKYFILTVLDPSLGKKTSDFAGITTSAINERGEIYILEARRFKRDVSKVPEEVEKTVRRFNSQVFALEPIGFQQILEKPIKELIERTGLSTRVTLLPTVHWPKATRILTLVPYFSCGNVYMKEEMHDLVDELLKFNPIRKNNRDDLIDSLSWHTHYWNIKPKFEQIREVEEGSLYWWLERERSSVRDYFWDFRKDSRENPVMIGAR